MASSAACALPPRHPICLTVVLMLVLVVKLPLRLSRFLGSGELGSGHAPLVAPALAHGHETVEPALVARRLEIALKLT